VLNCTEVSGPYRNGWTGYTKVYEPGFARRGKKRFSDFQAGARTNRRDIVEKADQPDTHLTRSFHSHGPSFTRPSPDSPATVIAANKNPARCAARRIISTLR